MDERMPAGRIELSRDLSRATVVGAFFLMPVAHLAGLMWPPDELYGPNAALGSWMWAVVLLLGVTALSVGTPSPRALRNSSTYGLFVLLGAISLLWTPDAREGADLLGRLATTLVVYLVAWGVAHNERLTGWLTTLSVAWIGWIGASFAAAWWFLPLGDVSRLMGISALGLPPLFVVATFRVRSFRRTLSLGIASLAVAMAADARMVLLVLAVLLLTSPSLDLAVPRRLLVGGAGAAALAVLVFMPAAQDRFFFFNSGNSVANVLTMGSDSILGARAEVWSRLSGECSDDWIIGQGIGASNVRGAEINSSFPQPHNEYIRIFCDTGLVGSVLLWGFFLMVGWRALLYLREAKHHPTAQIATLQLSMALLLLSATDIPLAATIQFMVPAAIVFAWSDRRLPYLPRARVSQPPHQVPLP